MLNRLRAIQEGTGRHCRLFLGGSSCMEFKPRWRLLGLCLVFRVYRSGPLDRVQGQGYFGLFIGAFLGSKKANIIYMM